MVRFKVKDLAKERQMTAEDLARASGVKLSTLQKLWSGKTTDPSFKTLSAIASALGVKMDDLVEADSSGNNLVLGAEIELAYA